MTAYPPLLSVVDFVSGTGGRVSASDPRLTPLLEGATAAVRRYCGWHVAPVADEALTLDGDGGTVLVLPTLHIDSLSGVTERGETLTEGTDYEWSTNGELRRLRGCWTDRWRAIEISLSHGFDTAPDLVQIIQQVVANALASPMGATREQAGIFAVSWATTAPGVSGGLSLLERDMAVLDRYRLPSRP